MLRLLFQLAFWLLVAGFKKGSDAFAAQVSRDR
jgi:hypothetical protein